MKSKKIILAILSVVLILTLTTVSFAAKTGMTFDEAVEASKEREKATNEVVNEEEANEVVEETENTVEEPVKEEVSENEKEEVSDEKVEEPKEETKEESEEDVKEIEEEGVVTFLDTISEDVIVGGEKIEYKSTYVDGNVHIMAEEVVLKDFKVDGNLFLCTTNAVLDNVLVEGSCYIIGETVKVDGQMDSAYILGDNVTITAFANIEKELRVASASFIFEGIVGRDLNVYAENVTVSDRAQVYGDCIIEAATVDISEDAKINGEEKITIVENSTNFSISNQYVYNTVIANCVIILIVAIFVLYSSPKFVAVNGRLRLRDFIKAFFTGILELVLVFAIFIGLSYIGYGIGFGFALLLLSLILVYFGKIIFIISAGIRLAGKSENVSKVKSFFIILIVLAIVEAVNLLQLLGVSGFIAAIIINLVLGIIGFGSFVRVVLAPTKKSKVIAKEQNNSNVIREAKPEDFVMKGAPIKGEKIIEEAKDELVEDIKEEVVEEVKEESKPQKEIKEKKAKKEKVKETVKEEKVDNKEENVEEKNVEEKNDDEKSKEEK